jgi:predicted amidohydrolase
LATWRDQRSARDRRGGASKAKEIEVSEHGTREELAAGLSFRDAFEKCGLAWRRKVGCTAGGYAAPTSTKQRNRTMIDELRVACGQFAAKPGDPASNVARMVAYAEQAHSEGCELILFPELIVTGYLAPPRVRPLAEPLSGPSVRRLAEAAADLEIAVAFGMAELDEARGVRYNSLVVVDRSAQVVAVYHKMHLWDTERAWAEPGRDVLGVELGGARYSGWICYDTRFPELARLSALAGAEIALVPTAWLGPGEEWELALRARALDNGIFCVGADIIGPDPALRCHGLSLIVGPKGNVLARAEAEQEGILCATLRRAELDAQRGRVPLLQHRRPELYGGLT